jgi:hypothetical protein
MTKCKGCGLEYRKGTLAIVLTPTGPKGHRVCSDCVSKGMFVVAQKVPVVVDPTKAQRQAAKDVLAPFIATLTAQLRGHRMATITGDITDVQCGYADGRIETLENVIHLLKGGRT